MAKQKQSSGGAANRRQRGLVAVLIPLPPHVRAAVAVAAQLAGHGAVTRWGAAVLEEAARQVYAANGLAWPEESSEKSTDSA